MPIMDTFNVIMDTFTLAQGWAKMCYTGKQPWNDSLEVINQQGFQSRGLSEGFWGNELTISPKYEVLSKRSWWFSFGVPGGERNLQKGTLVQDLARKRDHKRNHHKGEGMVGCKIMNSWINSRSTVASSYAQSNNYTFEEEILIMTSIQPWLWAAIRKFQSSAVISEIWLGAEDQRGRGLPQLSNMYLLALIHSTV
jgi:hypothetical protein